MLKTEIGFTAGDIYNLLKEKGPLTLKEIINLIKAEQAISVMAVGWLAREDKIEFFQEGKKKLIKLKG
ncbi:MAG: winged helix-turn-helix domain-containing protein [Deltaproteobacteria bacterium]|nr:winged helix-turn-helix domain-containing protein [Deltaproteobacteria bacterium]